MIISKAMRMGRPRQPSLSAPPPCHKGLRETKCSSSSCPLCPSLPAPPARHPTSRQSRRGTGRLSVNKGKQKLTTHAAAEGRKEAEMETLAETFCARFVSRWYDVKRIAP